MEIRVYFAMQIFFFAFIPEFVDIRVQFAMETFIFWSTLSNSKEKSFCAPPKKLFMPSSHATLAPGVDPMALKFCFFPKKY